MSNKPDEEAFESLEDAALRLLAKMDERMKLASERPYGSEEFASGVSSLLDCTRNGRKDCYEAPMRPPATTADSNRGGFTMRSSKGATRCGYGKTETLRLNVPANDDEALEW